MQVSGVDEVIGDYRNRFLDSKSPTVDIEILVRYRARKQAADFARSRLLTRAVPYQIFRGLISARATNFHLMDLFVKLHAPIRSLNE